MFINGIYVLGTPLPIGKEHYAIARVADVTGDIPEKLSETTYTAVDRDVEYVTVRPSEFKFENSHCEKMMAFYVLVREVESKDEEGSDVTIYKIIENIDEFLAPFDFPEDIKRDYAGYFLNTRASGIGLELVNYNLEDEEADGPAPAFGWINAFEEQYINACMDDKGITECGQVLSPQQISQAKSDNAIKVLFAEMLDKAVDLYNGLHYANKAGEIAEIISNITYINPSGEIGPLNFTAVEKLLSNIKDRLLVGASAAKPVVRRNEEQ